MPHIDHLDKSFSEMSKVAADYQKYINDNQNVLNEEELSLLKDTLEVITLQLNVMRHYRNLIIQQTLSKEKQVVLDLLIDDIEQHKKFIT